MEPSPQPEKRPQPAPTAPQPKTDRTDSAARRGSGPDTQPPSSMRRGILFGALLIAAVGIAAYGTGYLHWPGSSPMTVPVASVSQSQPSVVDEQDKVHWIGVRIQNVTPDIAQAQGSSRASRIVVRTVRPNSPADQAGMRIDDIILAADGVPMQQTTDFVNKIKLTTVGDQISITFERNGTVQTTMVRVVLENRCKRPGTPLCSF